MPHEVDMELGRGDESLGAHGALPLPFLAVAWPMAAAVPLAGEVVMNMAAQVGLEVSIGGTLLSAVADVYIWMFGDTFGTKASLLMWHSNAQQNMSMIHINTVCGSKGRCRETFTLTPFSCGAPFSALKVSQFKVAGRTNLVMVLNTALPNLKF